MRLSTALLVCSLAGCVAAPTRPPAAPDGGAIAGGPAGSASIPDLAGLPEPPVRAEARSRYGNPASYEVFGRRYFVTAAQPGQIERGIASWYGPGFHQARTSSGETYDMYQLTAAHRNLPIPAIARITNLRNGRTVLVRVNDRGPFVGERIVDLSYAAAARLDMLREGTAPVELEVLAVDSMGPGTALPERPAMAAPTAGAQPGSVPMPMPTPVTTLAPVAPQDAAGAARWLQAGAFATRANAEEQAARLRDAGIAQVRVLQAVAAERLVFRVQAGPVANALEADDFIERLRLAGVPDARLARD